MLNKFSNVFKSKSVDIKDKLKDYLGSTASNMSKKEATK